MDMIDSFHYLDSFVNKMKEKIIKRSEKYSDDDTQTLPYIKEHLIDEIIEMFDLNDDEIIIIKSILLKHSIKSDECIDVANMCWIYDYISFVNNNESCYIKSHIHISNKIDYSMFEDEKPEGCDSVRHLIKK